MGNDNIKLLVGLAAIGVVAYLVLSNGEHGKKKKHRGHGKMNMPSTSTMSAAVPAMPSATPTVAPPAPVPTQDFNSPDGSLQTSSTFAPTASTFASADGAGNHTGGLTMGAGGRITPNGVMIGKRYGGDNFM